MHIANFDIANLSGTVVTGMQTMFMLQVDAGDIIQVYHPTRYWVQTDVE